MKLIGRHDRMLLVGGIIAAIVMFAPPVRAFIIRATELDESIGFSLLPALVILTVVFFFHLQSKKQELNAIAAAAAAEAGQAEARAAEMERLVTFGQTLGRSLDLESIHDVVAQQLPRLVDHDEAWVMVRVDGRWHALLGTLREARKEVEKSHQKVADQALLEVTDTIALGPLLVHGHFCLPLTAGGQTLGVLGLPESAGPFGEGRKRALAAIATLLAISVRNAQLFREVHENSLRDGLTGCFNRTHAIDAIDIELRRARRSRAPVSLIMFDIDHFKQINDKYGHLCGDAVLAAVGARMRDVLRGSDLKCRYGGEEFLILLPDTPTEGAERVAETLRSELAAMALDWKDGTIRITASFGVATGHRAELDAHTLIGRADAALYQAKSNGRNCVQLSTEAAPAGAAVAVA
jgi:diguanylate cyclase (GGDEF)-like protein